MLASEIVQAAFRENNLIAIGATPTTNELAEGLSRLNSFLDALFGHELGELVCDWPVPPPQRTAPVTANYPLAPGGSSWADLPTDVWPYPPANVRLMVSNTVLTTVYFQNMPGDGARMELIDLGMSAVLTLDGNGRLIEDSPTRTVAVGEADLDPLVWLYRADLGNWIAIADLELFDDSPLPAAFDDLLITGTNLRLCPTQGKQPQPATVTTYADQLKKLKARYRQQMPMLTSRGEATPSRQTFNGRYEPWMV